MLRQYINGIGRGYFIFNEYNISENLPPAICMPENVAPNVDNFIRGIDDFLDRHKDEGTKLENMDIDYVLLGSLIETFPRSKSDKR